MTATSQFFEWWFTAGGIGGWVLFLLACVGAIAWLILDTSSRRFRAAAWLMGAILPVLLILPSAYVGLSPMALIRLQGSLELLFYLGLVGGLIPVIVAVGYAFTYQGLRGCAEGHVYEALLPECPLCAEKRQAMMPAQPTARAQPSAWRPTAPAPPDRAHVAAWLVDVRTADSYQLYQGDTRMGRGRQGNELALSDATVSREHILIREQQGHFTIYDRASTVGTYVNGHLLESPMLLAPDDLIDIGDTQLRFVTTSR